MNFKDAQTLPEGMFDSGKPKPFGEWTVPEPWCGDRSMSGSCIVCWKRTRFYFIHADMLPSFVCSEECFDQTGFRGSYVAPAAEAPHFALPERPAEGPADEVLDGEDLLCTGLEVDEVEPVTPSPDGVLQSA